MLFQRKQHFTKGKFTSNNYKCNFSSGFEISYQNRSIHTVVLKIIHAFPAVNGAGSPGPPHAELRTPARSRGGALQVAVCSGRSQAGPPATRPHSLPICPPRDHRIVLVHFKASYAHQCPESRRTPLTRVPWRLTSLCVPSTELPRVLMSRGVLRESSSFCFYPQPFFASGI